MLGSDRKIINTMLDSHSLMMKLRHPRLRLADRFAWLLATTLALCTSFGVAATSAGSLGIELNKLESHGDACRPYLVFSNQTGKGFESLALELVLFDDDGFILKRFSLDAAPLAPGKTSVKLFEIADQPCKTLGRILLNAVTACADGSGPLDDCLERIEPSSRLPVDFFK